MKTPVADKNSEPTARPQTEADALALEAEHVHQVYDAIARHFSSTRYKPWPRVSAFLASLEPRSLVVDVGCGNGKYSDCRDDIYWLGSDRSANLLRCCHVKHASKGFAPALLVDDVMRPAVRPGVADAVICIAVVHHLSSPERRLCALREIAEILKLGGRLLLYVWAREQESDSVGGRDFTNGDCLVPWHAQQNLLSDKADDKPQTASGLRTYKRYYHVFTRHEVSELTAPGLRQDDVVFDKNNWALYYTKV